MQPRRSKIVQRQRKIWFEIIKLMSLVVFTTYIDEIMTKFLSKMKKFGDAEEIPEISKCAFCGRCCVYVKK